MLNCYNAELFTATGFQNKRLTGNQKRMVRIGKCNMYGLGLGDRTCGSGSVRVGKSNMYGLGLGLVKVIRVSCLSKRILSILKMSKKVNSLKILISKTF